MQKFLKNLFTAQRCRRAMFFLLFAAVMLLNSSPELRADALYLIADGDTVSVLDGTTDIRRSASLSPARRAVTRKSRSLPVKR